ncbi:hypothetical protein J8273_1331 [Carpediemonas membranifera]|uniref:Uncharacterized protein n=1 Tax=Carpediemonas membranifera TaxID=201153 RepID=A0A8J6E6D4_9EUKA|nr:hypothetical protein J8273_1331 [Carpediemonas membranifera]|eukprot:KAG9396982.1 hypothetical protein J8273_1331 [Carpediemonas membranifera]
MQQSREGADLLRPRRLTTAEELEIDENETILQSVRKYPLGKSSGTNPKDNEFVYGKPSDDVDEHVVQAVQSNVLFSTQYEDEQQRPISRNRVGLPINQAALPPGRAQKLNYKWPGGVDPDCTRFGDSVPKSELDSAKAALTFESEDFKTNELIAMAMERQIGRPVVTPKVTSAPVGRIPDGPVAGIPTIGDGQSVGQLLAHDSWMPHKEKPRRDPTAAPVAGVPSVRGDLAAPQSRKVTDATNYGTELGVAGAVRPPPGTEAGVDEDLRIAQPVDKILEILDKSGWSAADIEKVAKSGLRELCLLDALAMV